MFHAVTNNLTSYYYVTPSFLILVPLQQGPTNQFMLQSPLMLGEPCKLKLFQMAKNSQSQLLVPLIQVKTVIAFSFMHRIDAQRCGEIKRLTKLLLTAAGLGSYVETLLRKTNTEFNVCYCIFFIYFPNFFLVILIKL